MITMAMMIMTWTKCCYHPDYGDHHYADRVGDGACDVRDDGHDHRDDDDDVDVVALGRPLFQKKKKKHRLLRQ